MSNLIRLFLQGCWLVWLLGVRRELLVGHMVLLDIARAHS